MDSKGTSPAEKPSSAARAGLSARARAEQIFRDKVAQSPVSLDDLSPQEAQLMLHELHVHQIELQLQNEELRHAQLELDAVQTGKAQASNKRAGVHIGGEGLELGAVDYITKPVNIKLAKLRIRNQLEHRLHVLQAGEERHRFILQTAMDGFLLVDAQGRLVEVNETYCRMSGYGAQELLSMRITDLEMKEPVDPAAARMLKIMTQGFDRFESRHRRKDGSVFVVEVNVQYWPNDGGRFVIFIQEITERKLAEQKLLHLQQELHGLSKAAHAALEAERRRTARELHDELGQSLTALKMDLESMRAGLTSHPELERRAQAMHVMLDSTIAATRRIAADLRPLMLDDLGLAAALDWLTQNFSKLTGIATDLVIDETVAQVPEPIASALYRITQESLTNVTKYAQATTVEVRLERNGEWVQLLVRDNGRGIRAADHNKRGAFGLLGMRERVMLLSGEIVIGGEPGRGSQVCARIPLDAAETQ